MAGGASYRRKNYRNASASRKAASVYKARSTVTKAPVDSKYNRPVYKKLRRKPRTRTKTGRNTNAIVTLARQVKQLQNQQYGDLQTHTQFVALSTAEVLPALQAPVAFCVSSFYDEHVYRGVITSGQATYAAVGTFLRQTLRSDLEDEYEWNAKRNSEAVSPIMYKPVFTRLSFRFFINYAGLSNPGRIRITVFKVKPYQASSKFNCSMPYALGAYRAMADTPSSPQRNYFDKQLHTVLYDKWIKVTPRTVTAGETDQRDITCIIPFKFPDVVYRPDFTTTPTTQTFFTNTPISQQIWCLVSADDAIAGHLVDIHVGRFNMWRDAHGTN